VAIFVFAESARIIRADLNDESEAAERSSKIQKSAGSALKENRAVKVGRFVLVSLN